MQRGLALSAALLGALSTLVVSACGTTAGERGDDAALNGARGAAPRLRVGDVVELPVEGELAGGALTTASPDEKYVVIVASTRMDTSGDELPWSIELAAPPSGGGMRLVEDCSIDAAEWAAIATPSEPTPHGSPIALGTTKTIASAGGAQVEDIQVKAVAVGEKAIVWADVTPSHPAVLDDAFVAQFLTDFERTILPRERTVFGIESDVDGDGRIGLVFTPLTRQTAVAYFTACDLVSLDGCPTNNAGDLLWLTPPNAIDPPYNTANAIKEILTHELAHLVHFNRKVMKNGLRDWTDSGYMIEGVGGFAQDAIGPQSGNLYVAMAGLAGIGKFSLGDTLVDGTRYDTDRDGVLRGGSYLFVRWLYDRAGGDVALESGEIRGNGGPALLRALVGAPESMAKALPRIVHRSIADIGTDFYTTLAMSNREQTSGGAAPTNRCFSYLPTQIDPITGKQRGANLFARFHGMGMSGVAMTDATRGTVRAGGASYAKVSAVAGGSLPLSVKVDPRSAPRVRVGRLE